MKKIIFLLSFVITIATTSFSQVKISEMPNYSGSIDTAKIPIVIDNKNYKITPSQIGTKKTSDGIVIENDSIKIGGHINSPIKWTTERSMNLNKNIWHISDGLDITEPGGNIFQWSYRPYSPLQITRKDSIDVNDKPYSDVPLSLINAERKIYYGSGKRQYGIYGSRFASIHYGLDSFVFRSDGGDYNHVIHGEQRFRFDPSFTGDRMVIRTGHNSIAGRHEGPAGIVANIVIDNTEALKRIYVRGTLSGFMSYIVSGGLQTQPDSIERFVHYNTGHFMGTASRILKTYGFAPTVMYGDSIWSFYSDNILWRQYFKGNTVFGDGGTSSNYKIKVQGTSYFSDSITTEKRIAVADTAGVDIKVRDRVTGLEKVITAESLGIGGVGVAQKAFTLNLMALNSAATTDGATNYFFASPSVWATSTALPEMTINRDCTIDKINIELQATTAGTAEDWTMYIRNTTTGVDYPISTTSLSSTRRNWSNGNLNIPVTAGDKLVIKSIAPTWATNPASVVPFGYITFKY